MMPRQILTDKLSLYTRKYVLGVLFALIALVLLWKGTFWVKVFAVFLFSLGLFYMLLRTIEFDDQFVYIGSGKYEFEKITKLSTIEINLFIFPYIVIDDNGRKRRYVTDAGQAGMLRIVLGIFIPTLDPLKNIKKFKQLYDASR